MGYCSYCGNWVDEGSICSHCGGSGDSWGGGGYDDEEDDEIEFDLLLSRYEYFITQAKTCSIKGDHKTAIKFYEEVIRLSGSYTNCPILSAIADEYESMGDYCLAEEYWNRCCAARKYDVYIYVAQKGDFLYRRGCYEEAIDTYEEAFEMLKDVKDEKFNLSMLKYHARMTHFIIDSYDKLGKDDGEDEYHNELKHAVKRFLHSNGSRCDENDAYYISQTAWQIYEDDKMIDEALILIDSAIELHPNADDYNRKAIILEYKLKIKAIINDIKPHDLELINEALKILPNDCDNGPYLKTKGDILNQLGDPVKTRVCYALAAKDYDKVNKVEKQLKKLKSGETYINITGIHHYKHFAPFRQGTIVDLIKEPDNPHDPYAIRVEIDGETVGYVANNRYTLIRQVTSAKNIKDTQSTQAEVQFILFDEWVIAKLI